MPKEFITYFFLDKKEQGQEMELLKEILFKLKEYKREELFFIQQILLDYIMNESLSDEIHNVALEIKEKIDLSIDSLNDLILNMCLLQLNTNSVYPNLVEAVPYRNVQDIYHDICSYCLNPPTSRDKNLIEKKRAYLYSISKHILGVLEQYPKFKEDDPQFVELLTMITKNSSFEADFKHNVQDLDTEIKKSLQYLNK